MPDRVLENRLLCNACEFGQTSSPYSNCSLYVVHLLAVTPFVQVWVIPPMPNHIISFWGRRVLFGFTNAYSICKRWRSFLGVDRRFLPYVPCVGNGRADHARYFASGILARSMVMTYYSSQLRIQSGYSRQQPSTYLEKRRYFTGPGRKVTFHRCASSTKFLSGVGDFRPGLCRPGRPHSDIGL